jgi:hypothetical protein
MTSAKWELGKGCHQHFGKFLVNPDFVVGGGGLVDSILKLYKALLADIKTITRAEIMWKYLHLDTK